PDAMTMPMPPPARDDAAGGDLKVALTGRRLWWIGGGLGAISLAVIVVAAISANPEAVPADEDAPGHGQVATSADGRSRAKPGARPPAGASGASGASTPK